jgi:hypothetical protein
MINGYNMETGKGGIFFKELEKIENEMLTAFFAVNHFS